MWFPVSSTCSEHENDARQGLSHGAPLMRGAAGTPPTTSALLEPRPHGLRGQARLAHPPALRSLAGSGPFREAFTVRNLQDPTSAVHVVVKAQVRASSSRVNPLG